MWDFDDLRAGGGGLWDQKATVLILPVITHDSAINDNTWEVSQLPKLASEVLLCVCVCVHAGIRLTCALKSFFFPSFSSSQPFARA